MYMLIVVRTVECMRRYYVQANLAGYELILEA